MARNIREGVVNTTSSRDDSDRADSRTHKLASEVASSGRSTSGAGVHASQAVGEELEEELEWEEWNGRGSFVHHMIAGSAAGVVEHLAMFPVDTYKTHQQTYAASRAAALSAGRPAPLPPPSLLDMLRRDGMIRMWRGAPAVLIGCIPSHAAYFTAYEFGREAFGLNRAAAGHQPFGAAATGALATILHDGILTPMDVVKQRLQLGYYSGVMHCLRSVIREEGTHALWRSYPTTLLMNIPYAAAVVASNESFKQMLIPITGSSSMLTYLLSGAGAGAIAAAVTCPLDVVKTRLQTAAVLAQEIGGRPAPARGLGGGARPTVLAGLQVQVATLYTAAGHAPRLPGAVDIAKAIWREEGARGFLNGVRARMAVHTPSQAISWATYEGIRGMLIRLNDEAPDR